MVFSVISSSGIFLQNSRPQNILLFVKVSQLIQTGQLACSTGQEGSKFCRILVFFDHTESQKRKIATSAKVLNLLCLPLCVHKPRVAGAVQQTDLSLIDLGQILMKAPIPKWLQL